MNALPKTYHYHPTTGEYQGQDVADPNPEVEGDCLVPAFATLTEPPEADEHECPVYSEGAWSIVPDWRGHTYWHADRTKHTITELGIEPPAGALEEMPPVPLNDMKSDACARIDSEAEATRLLFLTPGAGQAMTYQAKDAEAHALAQDANPDPANYPMLAAMIGLDGDTLEEVGETIRTRAAEWALIGAEIERTRQSAKQAVNATTTHEEIEAILDGLTWPTPSDG
ncbi:hypothetical protein RHODOSMS8_00030 [Rhodobiaceae bacterium]|nr:hypothetical protein RHODOSMS8_00030 [Rhodobiaceae bacterium]